MLRARRIPLRLLVAALALSPAIAIGLPGQAIAPGTALRLTLKGDRPAVLLGTLVRVDGDTILLELRQRYESADTGRTVPLAAVARVDVSQGRHGHAKTGAFVGLGVGALTGAATFIALASMFEESDDGDYTADGFLGGVLGGAAGAGIGALIGWGIRGEGWKTVPVSSFRVAPVAAGRVGLGVSIRF